MPKTTFEKLYEKLGYVFKCPSLLEEALTHRSYAATNNERFEFLGDSILSFIIARELYEGYPKASEGDLSRIRSHLVQGETLAEIARELQLGEFLRLGQGELKTGGAERASILSDAVEAIIAAIFLDGGLEICKSSVLRLFKERLSQVVVSWEVRDPKTQLQELLQSQKRPLPVYELVSVEGDLHQQVFTMRCKVKGFSGETVGTGTSRRKAERAAADAFLKFILSQ